MARVDSITRYSGKIGDQVFVNSTKYGPLVRKVPIKGRRRNEPAFKEQYVRATYLNKLASEINHTIAGYFPELKGNDLYPHLLSRFRREPLNNRFLLLLQLKEMSIHRGYPFEALGKCTTTIKRQGDIFRICLDTIHHPPDHYEADAYYYELLLITWENENDKEIHSLQRTDWIAMNGPQVGFDVDFTINGDTKHWLLCLRQGLGKEGKEFYTMPTNRVQFRSAGTFNPLDLEIVEDREKHLDQKETNSKRGNKEVVVVKAREVNSQ